MFYTKLLILFRKVYKIYFTKFRLNKFRKKYILNNNVINNSDIGSKIIYKFLNNKKPCLITRFGRHEIDILLNYLSINKKINFVDFIKGKVHENWWHFNKCEKLKKNAGFFPIDSKNLKKFSKLYISHMDDIDVLAIFISDPRPENFFRNKLKHTIKVNLESIDFFSSEFLWSKALKNKKVLFISPFSESIKKQYLKKDKIFSDQRLPKFQLKTLQSVNSAGGKSDEFKTWFEALDHMKLQIKKIDFDIAIIGCGAYGYPLAAYVKKIGKIGFHIGGELQTMFGILGRRFENPKHKNGLYLKYINKYWVRPSLKERPKNYKEIEKGGYW